MERCACVLPAKLLSRVRLFATPWTVAHQAPLSVGFSRQEYWSGVAVSSSRGSSPPRIKPGSLVSCLGRRVLYPEPPGKALYGDPTALRDLRCKKRKDFQVNCLLCFCLC